MGKYDVFKNFDKNEFLVSSVVDEINHDILNDTDNLLKLHLDILSKVKFIPDNGGKPKDYYFNQITPIINGVDEKKFYRKYEPYKDKYYFEISFYTYFDNDGNQYMESPSVYPGINLMPLNESSTLIKDSFKDFIEDILLTETVCERMNVLYNFATSNNSKT